MGYGAKYLELTQGEVQHKGDLGIDKTHERFEPMI